MTDTPVHLPDLASTQVRDDIVRLFRRDLAGPTEPEDTDLANERLGMRPSNWYLTGFLVPNEDAPEPEEDEAEREQFLEGLGGNSAEQGQSDEDQGETEPSRRRFLPSSMGLTVMLPLEVMSIEAEVTWGDYRPEPPLPAEFLVAESELKDEKPKIEWVRTPRSATVTLHFENGGGGPMAAVPVPGSGSTLSSGDALELRGHWRRVEVERPDGSIETSRVLTVFVVNRRAQARRGYTDVSYTFQTTLTLRCPEGFMPRRDYSDYGSDDADRRLADLHYCDVVEYGVGRNAAAVWEDGAPVTWVRTELFPVFDVPRVAPNESIGSVEFGMVELQQAAADGPAAIDAALGRLPALYGEWIEAQAVFVDGLPPRRGEVARGLIDRMRLARERIADGITLIRDDNHARCAFEIMNRAIETAARRREPGVAEWKWRPFQLAFILMNLRGLVERGHSDREIVDLLFFPTGGGKTEAYLGLTAFTIAHRRLTASGVLGAGVTVIMRYTLRLLTLDQLSRAAGVICALELLREGLDYRDASGRKLLGDWEIEIGLWAGQAASPNRFVKKSDPKGKTAKVWVRQYRDGQRDDAPAPIKECPWCRTPLSKNSFALMRNAVTPTRLDLRCDNIDCDFTGERRLPILVVDEEIYRRLPAFIVATVDKFASLPWEGRVGAFFGHVDRHDEHGFYGADEPGQGRHILNGDTLPPPALIIQDELHLISGPLGTVAGLYEAAVDHLSCRELNGKPVRPKVVASSATVRRAEQQIDALFDRSRTEVFPPPGVGRDDSYFARTIPVDAGNPGRRYLGVAAQGRGPKLLFLKALVTVLAAAAAHHQRHAHLSANENPADPYMTAVCYFNALRELGGARRIVEDEVREKSRRYGQERRRVHPVDAPFVDHERYRLEELTSRVSTDQVAETKDRLAEYYTCSDRTLDVALATNMISVGLDITRLGLMLVQGQPKTSSEYIQATSRVGRNPRRPGLVLAILNLHKPRDRMHFEQFGQFHRTFYRSVEATSVTPWATRALDRALAAVVVAIARHSVPDMARQQAAAHIADHPDLQDRIVRLMVSRAEGHDIPGGSAALEARIRRLLDAWVQIAADQAGAGVDFVYAKPAGGPTSLLHMPLSPALDDLANDDHRLFIAGRSMRDVEHEVPVRICGPNGKAPQGEPA